MNSDDRRLNRTDWLFAGAIFAVALTVRLVFLFTSPDRGWPHSALYEGDAPTWVAWANALDRAEAFEFNLPLRSPGMAYLLSWIHPGELPADFTPFKALWCVFTALACSLTYLACAREFSRRCALIAAGLCSFSFGTYIISTSLNNEALYMLAVVLIAFAAQQFARKPTWSVAAMLGALNGIAMLIRFEHLALLLMLGVYLAWESDSKSMRFVARLAVIAVMIATAVVVCLPWSIRGSLSTQRFNAVSEDVPDFEHANPPWTSEAREFIQTLPAFARDGNFRYITFLAQQSGKPSVQLDDVQSFFRQQFGYVPEPLPSWTLLSLKGPVDFALANHPDASGGFSKAALLREGDADPAIMFGRPDHLRLFNHGYSIGRSYIRSDFGGWITNLGRKLSHFCDGVAMGFTSRNVPLGWTGERRPVDVFTASARDSRARAVVLVSWKILILALVCGGAAICIVQRRGGIWLLIIAYKLIVTLLFYGYARQAISIAPVYFILMAVAIEFCLRRILDGRANLGKMAAIVGAIAVVVLLVVDISGSLTRPRLAITGTVEFTPQWGPESFQSLAPIHLAPTEQVESH